MVDGNTIIIIFYFTYCVCANYKCCIIPSKGPDLENKVSCILYLVQTVFSVVSSNWSIRFFFVFTFLHKVFYIFNFGFFAKRHLPQCSDGPC